MKRQRVAAVLAGAAAVLLPVFVRSQFALDMAILTLFYVGLTAAWNLVTFSGRLSLGHAAFFGLGAYTATLLFVRAGIPPVIGAAVAVVVSLLGGLLMVLVMVRLRGPFFTLASIAFAEVLQLVATHWRSLTDGSVGLHIPFRPGWQNLTFTSKEPYYYIALALAVLSVWLGHRLYHSSTGYFLRAASSDEEACQALGVNIKRAQAAALLWSAGMTGLLGVFYAYFIYVIEPTTFFSMELFSLQPALNGIIGGVGTVWGPVLGALVMTPLGEYLRTFLGAMQQGLHFLVYGLVLLVIVRVLPGGFMSIITGVRARNDDRGSGANERGRSYTAAS
ncbi:MAG: branched-chain amino acid ABC transporter permease [Firmicutes bacterium]|nr:branched-chain amino acid ABC transporter permease [Bacillota bacterium]